MASQPPPVLTVSYRFERGDYAALCRALQRKPLGRTLAEIAVFVAIAGLALFAAVGFDSARLLRVLADPPSAGLGWWIWIALLGPVLVILRPYSTTLFAALTFRRLAAANKEVTLVFDGHGVTGTSPNFESRVGWEAFERLIETPTHAFLAISRREALVVPRRAFADEHDYRMLMGFVRARLAANATAKPVRP